MSILYKEYIIEILSFSKNDKIRSITAMLNIEENKSFFKITLLP